MNYLDFELVIGAGFGKKRVHHVAVNASPAGEANELMEFPFNEQELESQLQALQHALLRSSSKRRKIISREERTVQNFGRALFDALFIKEIRSCYDVSQDRAFHQGKGLRVKLHVQSAELASLPWEFLYDKRQDKYICLSNNTPIIRYLDLPKPVYSLTVAPPLSILGMIANPKDLSDLGVEREKHRLEKSIEILRNKGLVKLTWLEGRTWQDLQRAMRTGPWHIFHFIGHGGFDAENDEGMICLEDDEGKAKDFSATDLARLLADHHSLRLIVLNSCDGARSSKLDIFSSTAAILVRQSVPAVLAMQYEITDTAAIELSRVLYEALSEGFPVDMAVAEARKAISIAIKDTLEWGTPVLYMRSPDGVLFNLPQISSNAPNIVPTHSSPAIDDQISLWLQSLSVRTRVLYEDNITKFRKILHSRRLDLDSSDENAIASLCEKWASRGIERPDISSSTFNLRRSTASSFYKFACQQRWRKSNPIDLVKRREEETHYAAKPLNVEKAKDALKKIDRSTRQGKHDYALLCILFTTGLHASEIVGLRCGDVTRTESSLTITYQQKGGNVKQLQLLQGTAQALLDYLKAVYSNEYSADDPIWISSSRNSTKGKAIGTIQSLSDFCKKRLGTSKIEATRLTYLAMKDDVGVKGIEALLNISAAGLTEQPQLFL